MKKLFITAAVLPLLAAGLSGCSASGITKAAQMVDQARKVQKTAKTVENVTGKDMGLVADPLNMEGRAEAKAAAEQAESAALLAEAEPIETAPMAVAMRKATSNAELSFSLDPMSTVQVQSSNGRGLNWLTYGTKKGAQSDAPFAVLGEKDTSTNALEQGLGAALGMATRAKKKTTQAVIIDPVRYEALALSAAKGWNAAFVEQVVAARSKES